MSIDYPKKHVPSKEKETVVEFIYMLPVRDYQEIEDLLNINEHWTELARVCNCSIMEIEKFRRHNYIPGDSPAKALLLYLGNRNLQTQALFLHFHKIELHRGMNILKKYVKKEYHHLIRYGPLMDLGQTRVSIQQPTLIPTTTYQNPVKITAGDYEAPDISQSMNITVPIRSDCRYPGSVQAIADARLLGDISAARAMQEVNQANAQRPRELYLTNQANQASPQTLSQHVYHDQLLKQQQQPLGQYPPQLQHQQAAHMDANVDQRLRQVQLYNNQQLQHNPQQLYPSYQQIQIADCQQQNVQLNPCLHPNNNVAKHLQASPRAIDNTLLKHQDSSIQDVQLRNMYCIPTSHHPNFGPQDGSPNLKASRQPSPNPPTSVTRVPLSSIPAQIQHPNRTRNVSSCSTYSLGGNSNQCSVPNLTIEELGKATNNWDPRNSIGKGGYGEVFKGDWLHQEVAIKRIRRDINLKDNNQIQKVIQQSFQEIMFLNQKKSNYIIPIMAYSDQIDNPCIVTQFMVNGSLDDRLKRKNSTPPLTWKKRYEIAKGTANGIQFLHSKFNGPNCLIHGDIKPGNILMDNNMEPKIADFGLAREIGVDQSKVFVSSISGTQFYLPHEYLADRQLNTKVDTYSFGVILFDLITGRPPNYRPNKSVPYLVELMKEDNINVWELVDKSVPLDEDHSRNIVQILHEYGRRCTRDKRKERPEMEEVFIKLKDCLLSWDLQNQYDSIKKQPVREAWGPTDSRQPPKEDGARGAQPAEPQRVCLVRKDRDLLSMSSSSQSRLPPPIISRKDTQSGFHGAVSQPRSSDLVPVTLDPAYLNHSDNIPDIEGLMISDEVKSRNLESFTSLQSTSSDLSTRSRGLDTDTAPSSDFTCEKRLELVDDMSTYADDLLDGWS